MAAFPQLIAAATLPPGLPPASGTPPTSPLTSSRYFRVAMYRVDTNGNGYADADELAIGSNPFARPGEPGFLPAASSADGTGTPGIAPIWDTDGDFSPDFEEIAAGTSPLLKYSAPVVLTCQKLDRWAIFDSSGSWREYEERFHGWEPGWWNGIPPEMLSGSPISMDPATTPRTLSGFMSDFAAGWSEFDVPSPDARKGLPPQSLFGEYLKPPPLIARRVSPRAGNPPATNGYIRAIGDQYRLRGPLSQGKQQRQFIKATWTQTEGFNQSHVPEYAAETLMEQPPATTEVITLTIPAGALYSPPYDVTPDAPDTPHTNVSDYLKVVRLLPVELRDINDHADTHDDVTITNWDTKQTITDNNIAWIEAHSSAIDAAPRMPQLELRIPGLGQGMTIEAKLEVQYDRGNGQRTARNQPEDTVRIPASGNFAQVNGDAWNLYSEAGWQTELTQHGFFGGEATLTYRLMNGQNQVLAPQTIRFRIGGKNPAPARAREFIETLNNAGPQGPLWFAYAIAKSESKDYNGNGTRYNQFWQLPSGANETAFRATRQTHAGRPVWGNDGGTTPGGYGIFQVTGTAADATANIARQQIWNWQENSRAALVILESKRTQADNWMTQQKSANNTNGVALPSLTVRNVTFAEGTNRTINNAVTMKAWNGASRPAAGFTDPGPAIAGFILDPHGSGHFCYWENSASGTNKWALNRYNAFNPPFNYVDRVCQEVE
jgi:hypothetical protein